jgi:hypothetical protein
MSEFTRVQPTLDNYWRAVILFGRNVACYKFALAQSLLEFVQAGRSTVPLGELAAPYARHITEHLKRAGKQATFRSSQFLDACRKFNRQELTQEQLVEATVRLGFNDVLDAFHVVGSGDIAVRFFRDERASSPKGIRLTDEAFRLAELYQHRNLPAEVEARWRLVETAWELGMPRHALVVAHDGEGCLVAQGHAQRTSVTSCRDALNGYQKGKCFYCFADVSVVEGADDLADVDHFFPHRLKPFRIAEPVDGVWNLVLACQACNRGPPGSSTACPRCATWSGYTSATSTSSTATTPCARRCCSRPAGRSRSGGRS